jgi:ABC-type uncharacterized transport system auxiliary subunit
LKLLIVAVLILAIITGCFGPKVGIEHVLLYMDPEVLQADSASQISGDYPFKVEIKKLKLAPLYDNANVITRRTDHSIKFSRKGKWAIRPNIAATDLLLQVIHSSFKLQEVKERFIDTSPDYIISGEIITIEEDLRNNQREASISMILWLKRYQDEKVLFQKKYYRSLPCARFGYSDLAKQLSLNLGGIYRSFVLNLVNVFNQELPPGQRKRDILDQDLQAKDMKTTEEKPAPDMLEEKKIVQEPAPETQDKEKDSQGQELEAQDEKNNGKDL